MMPQIGKWSLKDYNFAFPYALKSLFFSIANLQILLSFDVPKMKPIIFSQDWIYLPSFLLTSLDPSVSQAPGFKSLWPLLTLPHIQRSIIYNEN